MSDFKTYMCLTDAKSVSEITTILSKHLIPFKVEDTSKSFDPSFSFNNTSKSILILLDIKDFEKANHVIDKELILNIDEIDKEHFLYTFSEEELLDVIKNSEEWHPLDVKLAKKIIKDKDFTINETEIINHKNAKQNKIYKPEKSSKTTILTGYVFSLIGGFIGIAIALFLINNKKTLPTGEKIYTYCKEDRNHGVKMLISSCIILIIYLFFALKK